ncbi:MAG: formate dehydrogenase accessory sulfurtransferase FdhD [Myxococcales bacterium]|nr:formate dehydrogenase accessory sulfurtransferase FdhD [Myxococcota bacterium]MDW8281859.1 formate dehydrogenase accessory sulfurtransferase FdhD [Myxococcales bacterium]
MEVDPGVAPTELLRVRGGEVAPCTDLLATEEPLEIRLEGPDRVVGQVAVTMRTPGHDLELAVGFLYTEGLLRGRQELGQPPVRTLVPHTAGHVLTVRLQVPFDAARLRRNFYATSSCGICGKASIDQVEQSAPPVAPGPMVPQRTILGLPGALRAAQRVFAHTGGLHATGLFDAGGRLLVLREDVGRHNAVDKVVGCALLGDMLPLSRHVMMVSGRLSFEIVQKAAMAAVPILCAVSAPSSLAVQAAQRLGLTLVGFVRGDSFNVYTHPERLVLDAAGSEQGEPG